MIETGVLISSNGEPCYWHLPRGRTMVCLPDDRNLWEVIWENREEISGFAHSHPGSGIPGPSWEDITTFAAVEAGLGVRLDWWVTSEDSLVFIRWSGPEKHSYTSLPVLFIPPWLDALRRWSYAEPKSHKNVEGEQHGNPSQ